MASAYYFAAHFNMPTTHVDQFQQPTMLNFPPSVMSHQPPPTKAVELTHNTPHPAARHLAGTRYMDEQEDSLFFCLPAELRNQIYTELLCPNTPNHKHLEQLDSHSFKQQRLYPAILSTCKKIYQEAENMLYTTNIFHAHPSLLTSLPHLSSSLKPIVDPSSIAKITRWQLTVRLDTDPRFTMSQATADFSGAEFLEIRVWQSMFDGCDASVLRLFTGIRGVKVARVNGSSDPQLARWLEDRMMMPMERKVESEKCACGDEREAKCGKCGKKVDVGEEWFAGRDAWTFGNR